MFTVELPQEAPPEAEVRRLTEALETTAHDERQLVEELRDRPPVTIGMLEAPLTARTPRPLPLMLVVEDNLEMNRFIRETLAPDHRVASAFDGREGLRTALELKPDLVLADIMMPEMSGDELVSAIRSHPELDPTPIVLLTAKANDELRLRLLREGAQDYITKPFSTQELRARIGNLIAGKMGLEHQTRLAALIEQASDGIFVADLEGRYTDVNQAGCRMLGYSREEILGKTIVDLIPQEDLARLWQVREVPAVPRVEEHAPSP